MSEGTPVTLTNNGIPVSPNDMGTPVTVVSSNANVVFNGDARQITVSGSYIDTVTFTVVDGVITEIALS